jgi:hypothetical protein
MLSVLQVRLALAVNEKALRLAAASGNLQDMIRLSAQRAVLKDTLIELLLTSRKVA